MLDRDLINEVLAHADIVNVISSYLNVIKKGRNYVALCPFHDDKNPSMMISKEKQLFKCFVCQEGGNAITFVKKIDNVSFEDAVRKVAEISGFDDPRLHDKTAKKVDDSKKPLYEAITTLNEFYKMSLHAQEGKKGYDYLINRGLNDEIIDEFSIGYSPDNPESSIAFLRASGTSVKVLEQIGVASFTSSKYVDRNASRIIFAIRDENGQVVGFSARDISGNADAKYINSPENAIFHKSSILYNYNNAKKYVRSEGYIYIVEGFMDAIALSRVGIKSVVALMGTALTSEHIGLLRKLKCEIRLCLDGDTAGQLATLKCIQILDKSMLKYRIIKRNKELAKDSDEILKNQGEEALKSYLNTLIDKSQFIFNYYRETNPLKTIEERRKFVSDMLPYLLNITSTLELEDYVLNIARLASFDVKTIRQYVENARNKQNNVEETVIFDPNRITQKKKISRFLLAQRFVVYYLLTDEKAIEFYEKNDIPITDEVYRKIISYITDFYYNHHVIDISALISEIEMNNGSDSLITSISDIVLDKSKYPTYSDDVMKEYRDIIIEERQEQYDKLMYDESKKGKSDEERLKLMLERNKRKAQELYKKEKKE